jgi:7-carboxy-7-deazaguanine synthase
MFVILAYLPVQAVSPVLFGHRRLFPYNITMTTKVLNHLRVNEIFESIQGESTYAGIPCVFVRLTGCNLRCSYCDTTYAYEEGTDMSVKEIINKIDDYSCKNVCITGGEPLLQKNIYKLINLLKTESYKIFVETNGAMNIDLLPGNIIRIMDVKCPDSGMNKKIDWRNLERLRGDDEVKFVLSSKKDYEWAKKIVRKHNLPDKTNVLFGSAYGKLKPKSLAGWILKDRLNVRLQLQLHRIIWPDKTRGV